MTSSFSPSRAQPASSPEPWHDLTVLEDQISIVTSNPTLTRLTGAAGWWALSARH